ncbi:MAG: sugar transferase [Chitinophagaceae bacterium]
MTPAPIVLFTFKRTEALKKSIASLLQCTLAGESELIVYSDAPRNEAENEKVQGVRQFLHSIKGFKNVKIIERPENLGVDYNLINGLKEIAAAHEKFIVIEDDLIYASNFLVYLNQALDFYRDYPDVLNASAFSFISKIPADYKYDAFFTSRSWTWGWASWGSKMKDIDWEVKDYPAFIKDAAQQDAFNKNGGSDLTKMLRETMEGKIRTWDIRMFYYQFKNQLLTLYPASSKVVNIGFHEEGSHTFGYNRYKTTLDESNKQQFVFQDSSKINKSLNAAFLRRNNLANRIATRIFSMMGIK